MSFGNTIRLTSTCEISTYPVTSRICSKKLRSKFSSYGNRKNSTSKQSIYETGTYVSDTPLSKFGDFSFWGFCRPVRLKVAQNVNKKLK